MPGLLLDTDQPSLLGTLDFGYARLATYADLMTPAIRDTFAGRLIAIDRGQGDPLRLATVADIESGLLTVQEGADKIREWNAEHRAYPTAYHDRAIWAEVEAALAGVPHHTWVSTLDLTLLPDGKRPDVVQFAGETAIGFHADMSVVWNDGWCPVRPAVDWPRVNRMLTQADDLLTMVRSLG